MAVMKKAWAYNSLPLFIIMMGMIVLSRGQDLDLYQRLVSCPDVQAPKDGFIKSRTKQDITIACNPGFQLTDRRNTRKCIHGSWFPPSLPTCLPIILSVPPISASCLTAPVVLNGRVQYSNGSAPYPKPKGSRATVVCEEGYFNHDTSQPRFEIECNGFGMWSKADGDLRISCTEKPCQSPPNVPRATFRFLPPAQVSKISSLEVEYICNNNSVLVDPSIDTKLICHNGQWEGSIPTCVPRTTCEMLGSILHGVWNVKEGSIETHPRFGLEVGEEIKYQCHSGYKLIGSSVLKCMPQGLWSSQVPECIPDSEPVYYCPRLPSIENGKCVCADVKGNSDLSFCMPFRRGSRVECSCWQGFTLQGSPILTCGYNARFNGPMPTCVQSFDESPGLIEMPPYKSHPGRPYNSADITDGKNKVSSLVIVVTTACSVLGVLLIIMAVMVFRRHKPHLRGMGGVGTGGPHLFQQGPSSPPYARVHNSSMDEHDRMALMAYVEASRVHLPSYEEATRQGNNDTNSSCIPSRVSGGAIMGNDSLFDYCSSNSSVNANNHQFYLQNQQYNASQTRPGNGSNDGNNNSASNQHSTFANSSTGNGANGNASTNMYRDGVSVSEMFGSIDTVNVSMSDASTSVTVETYDSSTCGRSVGSSSQQATAGSLQSSRDQLSNEDAPLLDSSSQRETDVVSMSSNPSRTSKDEQ
ncbi:hypothetical protein RRG08_013414 [Elysia crispata]|uniref:Sushi domain-containing protein n=1 Tax=Elysia crispata TaxID=231223 RepID=A0AAE0ZPQ2_9GAST|nr:hypothetical protein RRG08_013414 [Elysia crispata]